MAVQEVLVPRLDQFFLRLPAAAIGQNQIVTVSYAVPATGTVIEDTAGNDALRFADRPVTNNSTLANTTPPVLVSAVVLAVGDRLTLTFNEDLDIEPGTKVPAASAFTVKADGVDVAVQEVLVPRLDQFFLRLPAAAIGQNQNRDRELRRAHDRHGHRGHRRQPSPGLRRRTGHQQLHRVCDGRHGQADDFRCAAGGQRAEGGHLRHRGRRRAAGRISPTSGCGSLPAAWGRLSARTAAATRCRPRTWAARSGWR